MEEYTLLLRYLGSGRPEGGMKLLFFLDGFIAVEKRSVRSLSKKILLLKPKNSDSRLRSGRTGGSCLQFISYSEEDAVDECQYHRISYEDIEPSAGKFWRSQG